MTRLFKGHSDASVRIFRLSALICLGMLISAASSCGTTGTGKDTSPTPPQPGYPSTPPVPITWSPQTSPLPAPQAQVPPPPGSNDFPLTIVSPSDGTSATSPLHVVANATPKNPIFFMRVYIDQLSVY